MEEAELEAAALNSVAWAIRALGAVECVLDTLDSRSTLSAAYDLARRADAWWLIGDAFWNLCLDPAFRRPGPSEPWDPALGLTEAQATYSYRRALGLGRTKSKAFRTVQAVFDLRRMDDARDVVARAGEQAAARAVVNLSYGPPPENVPLNLSQADRGALRKPPTVGGPDSGPRSRATGNNAAVANR